MRLNAPVVGLDVDGTMGEYHNHFIWFAEMYFGKEIPRDYDGSVSLARWCGVSKQRYRQAKLAFRRSGLKRAMPAFEGASELARTIRARGARVVICTTRPFLALEVVEEDTRIWLRRNGIQYDNIINGEHKYRELVRSYGLDRIVCVLEDLPEMISQAERLSLPALLRRGKHNSEVTWKTSVGSLPEAQEVILGLLSEWKKEHRRA